MTHYLRVCWFCIRDLDVDFLILAVLNNSHFTHSVALPHSFACHPVMSIVSMGLHRDATILSMPFDIYHNLAHFLDALSFARLVMVRDHIATIFREILTPTISHLSLSKMSCGTVGASG